ncbi:hypothetical protein F5Y03DRAFT_363765 [Xylaria venustula]|nr:hypothetical protein F5Y03DRAFT_363765 [Xylaria venustula]
MFAKTLITAAIIGTATARFPIIADRDDSIQNRADSSARAECSSALSAVETLFSSAPTPPADLLSVTLPADPCVTPSFTGALATEWPSYTSAALQWYASHTSELNDFVSACEGVLSDAAAQVGPQVCTSALVGAGVTAASTTAAAVTTTTAASVTSVASVSSASSTGAGDAITSSSAVSSAGVSGSASPSSSSSTVSTPNAAPRETGFAVVAAVAAAGFMGAVAVL